MLQTIYKSAVMQVTGTTTATSLRDLMNTATAGAWDLAANAGVDYIILNPEGTIRYTIGGQTPTAAIGMEGTNLEHYEILSNLDDVIIINAAKINITVGYSSFI